MTLNTTQLDPAQIEQALLAPCMDAVIAVTERYQYLEHHRGARVFTAYGKSTTCCTWASTTTSRTRPARNCRSEIPAHGSP